MTAREPTQLVQQLLESRRWSAEDARAFFEALVRGELEDVLLSAAVTAIATRDIASEELTGAAQALLAASMQFPRPEFPFADVVGTGGDGLHTLNISTLTAFTAAACGCKMIKHGNRSITSNSGSFDLLQSLGVDGGIGPEEARQQVDRYGVTFLFAPYYHPGLRHAAAVRAKLKFRTVFNLLGPLVNPARPSRILLGVARVQWAMPMAEALRRLGIEQALVVHGAGLDEVAVHAATQVLEVTPHTIVEYELTPEDFGAPRHELAGLTCPDPRLSHARARRVLEGLGSPVENDAVALNTALVLKLFGHHDLAENYRQALESLHSAAPAQLVSAMTQQASET